MWRLSRASLADLAPGYQAPATFAAQFPAMGDRLRHPDPLPRSPIAPPALACQSHPGTPASHG